MCQITPFTLPCCRRVYVLAKKISTCPDEWPNLKCPPDLCLQIGTHEPSSAVHKTEGTCWRCKAHWEGITGQERERLRPAIDHGELVEGLEETTPEERRRRVESSGKCWFCMGDASKRCCDMCGVKLRASRFFSTSIGGPPPSRSKPSGRGEKRHQLISNATNKRSKSGNSYSGGPMENRGKGFEYADMSSPYHAAYHTENDPFVVLPERFHSQNISNHPQNDGLPIINTHTQCLPPQDFENDSPNYDFQQPQHNTNWPGGYSEVPYQTQNCSPVDTSLPPSREYLAGSKFITPSSNILNPGSFQSRRHVSISLSPNNPQSYFLGQIQNQQGIQIERRQLDVPGCQLNPSNFDQRPSNQSPQLEGQEYPLVRDFAEGTFLGSTIDPQLLSSNRGLEDRSSYPFTSTLSGCEKETRIKRGIRAQQDTSYQSSQTQTRTAQPQPETPGGETKARSISSVARVEADDENTVTGIDPRTTSEISQLIHPQSVEFGRDAFSQNLWDDSELSRILDEFAEISSVS